jgi:hypothetical protein
MNLRTIGRLSILTLGIGLGAPAAIASTLAVNFVNNRFDTFQQQPGFESFYVPNNIGTMESASPNILAGTSGGVSVYVRSDQHGPIRSIDRGNVRVYDGQLSNLSISWIGNGHRAGRFSIRLRGVTAGLHHWTSYHVDNGTGLMRNGDQNGLMRIELSLDGGDSYQILDPAYRILDAEYDPIQTLQPADPPNFLFHTSFVANGTHDVVFRFDNVGSGPDFRGQYPVGADFTVINGFRLVGVPEPSALALIALACGPLLAGRANRGVFGRTSGSPVEKS